MQMRVAFAVATAFRPEILIIDEALSVGDTYFQHKSFERIKQFRHQGTTLLFVSHDKSAILALCNRAILIEAGRIIKDGNPEEVTDYYNALIAEKENNTIRQQPNATGKTQTISGTGEATIEDINLYNQHGQSVEVVNVGEPLELRVDVHIHHPIPTLVLGYAIKDRLGQTLFGTNTWLTDQPIHQPQAGQHYTFSIKFNADYGVGSYSIVLALTDQDTHLTANYEWRDMAYLFSVTNLDKPHFVGLQWQTPAITITEQNHE
jgi:lipopolysaccharide transport system ATP-binding protein